MSHWSRGWAKVASLGRPHCWLHEGPSYAVMVSWCCTWYWYHSCCHQTCGYRLRSILHPTASRPPPPAPHTHTTISLPCKSPTDHLGQVSDGETQLHN